MPIEPVHGNELWMSNGTVTGTSLVDDVFPGPASSNPSAAVAVGSEAYFTANDGVHGVQLYETDGTAANTVVVTPTATVASAIPAT